MHGAAVSRGLALAFSPGGYGRLVLTVDLHDAQLWQDPYPVWRRAMDEHRTARTTRGEAILLRADDLDTAPLIRRSPNSGWARWKCSASVTVRFTSGAG